MEWSKLKNVILLMLLCVNIILLLLVGSQASRDKRYQEETRQAAQTVLEQGGIDFTLDEFPDDLALSVTTVTRDRTGEAGIAAALAVPGTPPPVDPEDRSPRQSADWLAMTERGAREPGPRTSAAGGRQP